jgi:hypothetical protein
MVNIHKLKNRVVTVYKQEETYPIKGYPITIIADVAVCNVCDNPILDEMLDSKNLERAYAKYRRERLDTQS